MRLVTTEEAWGVLRRHEYTFQFAGGWLNLHPELTLVGRAVTAPSSPSARTSRGRCRSGGRRGGASGARTPGSSTPWCKTTAWWWTSSGKVKNGTFAGDNLGTSIHAKTGTGMVITTGRAGRAAPPTRSPTSPSSCAPRPHRHRRRHPHRDQLPIRIDEATCLPGGRGAGDAHRGHLHSPHLAQEVVERSEDVRLRESFGHQRLREGRYTPGRSTARWSEEIEADFAAWRRSRGV